MEQPTLTERCRFAIGDCYDAVNDARVAVKTEDWPEVRRQAINVAAHAVRLLMALGEQGEADAEPLDLHAKLDEFSDSFPALESDEAQRAAYKEALALEPSTKTLYCLIGERNRLQGVIDAVDDALGVAWEDRLETISELKQEKEVDAETIAKLGGQLNRVTQQLKTSRVAERRYEAQLERIADAIGWTPAEDEDLEGFARTLCNDLAETEGELVEAQEQARSFAATNDEVMAQNRKLSAELEEMRKAHDWRKGQMNEIAWLVAAGDNTRDLVDAVRFVADGYRDAKPWQQVVDQARGVLGLDKREGLVAACKALKAERDDLQGILDGKAELDPPTPYALFYSKVAQKRLFDEATRLRSERDRAKKLLSDALSTRDEAVQRVVHIGELLGGLEDVGEINAKVADLMRWADDIDKLRQDHGAELLGIANAMGLKSTAGLTGAVGKLYQIHNRVSDELECPPNVDLGDRAAEIMEQRNALADDLGKASVECRDWRQAAEKLAAAGAEMATKLVRYR